MRYITLLLTLLIFVGCSSVSKEKYDHVKMGMTYANVTDVLGKANKCDALAGVSDCTWGDDKKYIKIKFVADKVIFMHSQGLE